MTAIDAILEQKQRIRNEFVQVMRLACPNYNREEVFDHDVQHLVGLYAKKLQRIGFDRGAAIQILLDAIA